MDTQHLFAREDVFPSWWANAAGYFLSVLAANLVVSKLDATHVQVAGLGFDGGVGPAVISVEGRWRWVETAVSRAHPGGAAGVYDLYVTAKDTDIVGVPAPYTDDTDYAFDLWIGASGATPPIVAGTVDVVWRIALLEWDGSEITRVTQTVPPVGPHSLQHSTTGSDPLSPADIAAASSTELADETTRAEAAEGVLSDAITAETARAETAEGSNAAAITAETTRAEAAEGLRAPLDSPIFTGSPNVPRFPSGQKTQELYGHVNGDGTIVAGGSGGFTVLRLTNGFYQITFTTAFANNGYSLIPVAINGFAMIDVGTHLAGSCVVMTTSPTGSGASIDAAFDFRAVGRVP